MNTICWINQKEKGINADGTEEALDMPWVWSSLMLAHLRLMGLVCPI